MDYEALECREHLVEIDMRHRAAVLSLLYSLLMVATIPIFGGRIKDLASIQGSRDNQLVGYGLVIGLAGDGDSTSDITINSLANSLKNFGLTVDPATIRAENVAAVMITANIPAFSREGTTIDVTVSSIGDAESLQGGELVQTPLFGANNEVYAVAQGKVRVGGFIGGATGPGGATVQKNHPTVGVTSAIVEREIEMNITEGGYVNWLLYNPDFATASKMAQSINEIFPASSKALDSAAVQVAIPEMYDGREVDFFSSLGAITVSPDTPARVIMNERTGVIVATADVRVSTVAISHGALTISIANNLNVSQPTGFGDAGDTAITPSTQTDVTEMAGGFKIIEEYPTIQQVTAALNAVGVTTREMMSILQEMKSVGALQADLIIK